MDMLIAKKGSLIFSQKNKNLSVAFVPLLRKIPHEVNGNLTSDLVRFSPQYVQHLRVEGRTKNSGFTKDPLDETKSFIIGTIKSLSTFFKALYLNKLINHGKHQPLDYHTGNFV